jgi:Tfp pilus assembly protein PilF
MSRAHKLLWLIVAAELAAVGVFAWRQQAYSSAPLPDASLIDHVTADELRQLAHNCRATSADDWEKLGESYAAYSLFRLAEACFRRAAELAPTDADIRFQWGFVLQQLGEYKASSEQYHLALENRLASPKDCWYFVGLNALRQDDAAAAAAAFEKAGDVPAAVLERARLMARSGDTAGARQLLDKLTAHFPGAVEPWMALGRVAQLQGDVASMRAAYDQALHAQGRLATPAVTQHSRLQRIKNSLGMQRRWAYAQRNLEAGQSRWAASRIRDALAVEFNGRAVYYLAQLEWEHKNYPEVERLLLDLIEREGPERHVVWLLGDVYEAQGHLSWARDSWERACELGSVVGVAALHEQLAKYYQHFQDEAAAKTHALASVYTAGAEAYWSGDLDAARSSLQRVVDSEPKHADAWFYLGEVYRRQNQPQRARECYQQCLQCNPDHGRALARLDAA